VLSACGGIGTSSSSTSTVPAATATPTPSPTSAPAAPSLLKYSNSYFIIGYPQGWTATASKSNTDNTTVFADSAQLYQFSASVTPDPNGALSADQIAQATVSAAETNLKNPQSVSVSATTTIDGKTWSQRGITGTKTKNGQTVVAEVIVLAYVANNQAYFIVYGTAQPLFSTASTAYFQPMLQSLQLK
jgi:hypothetical protein